MYSPFRDYDYHLLRIERAGQALALMFLAFPGWAAEDPPPGPTSSAAFRNSPVPEQAAHEASPSQLPETQFRDPIRDPVAPAAPQIETETEAETTTNADDSPTQVKTPTQRSTQSNAKAAPTAARPPTRQTYPAYSYNPTHPAMPLPATSVPPFPAPPKHYVYRRPSSDPHRYRNERPYWGSAVPGYRPPVALQPYPRPTPTVAQPRRSLAPMVSPPSSDSASSNHASPAAPQAKPDPVDHRPDAARWADNPASPRSPVSQPEVENSLGSNPAQFRPPELQGSP